MDFVRKHQRELHRDLAGMERANAHLPAEMLTALRSRDSAVYATALVVQRPIFSPFPSDLDHVLTGEWYSTCAHPAGPVTGTGSEGGEIRPRLGLSKLAAVGSRMLCSNDRCASPAPLTRDACADAEWSSE